MFPQPQPRTEQHHHKHQRTQRKRQRQAAAPQDQHPHEKRADVTGDRRQNPWVARHFGQPLPVEIHLPQLVPGDLGKQLPGALGANQQRPQHHGAEAFVQPALIDILRTHA